MTSRRFGIQVAPRRWFIPAVVITVPSHPGSFVRVPVKRIRGLTLEHAWRRGINWLDEHGETR